MPCQVISDYDNCKQFPWNVDGLAEGAFAGMAVFKSDDLTNGIQIDRSSLDSCWSYYLIEKVRSFKNIT